LAQPAERLDSEDRFSDLPPLKESFWKNASITRFAAR